MSEKEILEEKIKEKKEFDAKEYIDKMLNKSFEETKGMAEALAHKHEHELESHKHSHATHSSEAFCPECGDKNPDFKDKQLVCKNCKNAVGTKEEITSGKVKFCRHCGHNEALEKE